MTTETATESNGASNEARPGPSHHSEIPQDARLISLIVASMGIEDMEPGVEMMLLEWAHRYVQTILSDSLLYASHAQSSSSTSVPNISLQDVILAIQSHLSHSMIQPPSKSTLLNLAGTLNSTPLPPISDRYGLRLPPREQCLTGVNFNIVPDPLDDDDEDDGDEEDNENETAAGSATAQRSAEAGSRRSEGVGEDEAEETLGAAMSRPGSGQADDSVGDTTMDTGDNGQRAGGAAEAQRGVKRSLEEDDEYD